MKERYRERTMEVVLNCVHEQTRVNGRIDGESKAALEERDKAKTKPQPKMKTKAKAKQDNDTALAAHSNGFVRPACTADNQRRAEGQGPHKYHAPGCLHQIGRAHV